MAIKKIPNQRLWLLGTAKIVKEPRISKVEKMESHLSTLSMVFEPW